ncbi:hypothetical protein AB205_0144140 [Aquarana catesbeiana]|uniref:Ribosome production factor 1 n=1 Tax=Aquarana catesbeiana TaxID=8400 RepID=A0A2G9QJ65_AQUCT|nr:hypothetical protein AB205_0144140 [Aquarana catesbeiana]
MKAPKQEEGGGESRAQPGEPEESSAAFPASFSLSEIKNKQRRHFMFLKMKQEKRKRTVKFTEQLSSIIPNSHVYYRRGLALKKIIPQCIARDFTDLIVLNEDRKIASIL